MAKSVANLLYSNHSDFHDYEISLIYDFRYFLITGFHPSAYLDLTSSLTYLAETFSNEVDLRL